MNAILKPNNDVEKQPEVRSDAQFQVQFQTITTAWLEPVLQIENAIYPHPWSRANFEDSIKTGYQLQALVASDGTLMGYFVAMKGFEEVHLLNITVAQAYQRQGWARAMLDALAVWSRGQGAQWLWLEVRTSNARALAVYQAQGFQLISIRQDYYPHGSKTNGREDAAVMRLTL